MCGVQTRTTAWHEICLLVKSVHISTRWLVWLLTVSLLQWRAPTDMCILGGQSTSGERSVSATSPSLMTLILPKVIVAELRSFVNLFIQYRNYCKTVLRTFCEPGLRITETKRNLKILSHITSLVNGSSRNRGVLAPFAVA